MTNRHNPPVIVGKRDENPIVFFAIAIGDRDVGRIIIAYQNAKSNPWCEQASALGLSLDSHKRHVKSETKE